MNGDQYHPATERLALLLFQNDHGIEPDYKEALQLLNGIGIYGISETAKSAKLEIQYRTKQYDYLERIASTLDHRAPPYNVKEHSPHIFRAAVHSYHFGGRKDWSIGENIVKLLNFELKNPDITDKKRGEIYRDLGRIKLRTTERGFFHFYGHKYTLAIVDWKKGAELGDADCMFYLGIANYTGKGTQRNLDEAKAQWGKAAALGHQRSIDQLKRLNNEEVELPQLKTEEWSGNITDLDSFQFGDDEIEDLLAADKGIVDRISHAMDRNAKAIEAIGKIAAGIFLTLLVVLGLVALTLAFPHVFVPIWITLGVVVGVATVPLGLLALGGGAH